MPMTEIGSKMYDRIHARCRLQHYEWIGYVPDHILGNGRSCILKVACGTM